VLEYEILETVGVVVVRPVERLSAEDFAALTAVVDPYIELRGSLAGLLIEAEYFPGWTGFAGFVSHIKFVRAHHEAIARIAIATDSTVAGFMPRVVDHFVGAEVRAFQYAERDIALAWLQGGEV